MPVTSVTTDTEALTLTVVADFPVPVERLWGAFADPRKLERFWGPPGYPATFDRYELRPGGIAHYWMTSPEGERFYGRWDFSEIEEPDRIVVLDSFADAEGEIDTSVPSGRMTLLFESTATGSRLTAVSESPTLEALEQVLAMGQAEGMREAFGQLDVVLAELREYALGKGTVTEVLDDTHVRITRAFEAPRHLLWRAHTEPELMRKWLLGPGGWEMTACENDFVVGGSYRNAWAPVGDTVGEPFGFDGENLVIDPERRIVTTERMTGAPFPANVNDLSFDEDGGITLLTLIISFPDVAQRDMVLATGMTTGMEASYQRLESEILASV
ncbi:SRPBCC family protein [Protaetiibacter larvae]|uniref:ATPase n=1 Tax=Protaetiibacter larvae TaxID=2592654 RepID=A0A5C1Y6R1_9MICO|nr:SRPBCC family protein [Protaetiibacter larvae]QEO09491.1 ATPase [Protaetiibacter larvae]